MGNSNQVNSRLINFYERYSSHTDAQILEILKNQKDYQENARSAAVKIAIERQLIHSEQDLLLPEFQNSRSAKLTLFPKTTSAYHYHRLVGSIFRFLYVLSFPPMVYGFLKYAEGYIDQTILGVGIGLAWFLLVVLLKRSAKPVILIPLFGILIFVGASVSLKIAENRPIRILDLVVLIIALLLSSYFLVLAKKLIQNQPAAEE